MPSPLLAHAGHGNEFQTQGSSAVQSVKVDRQTAERLGLKIEPARRQALAIAVKTTGQVEALPDKSITVTTPIPGTITQLLVQPGDRVQQGQPLAILSSPELGQLRVESQENRIEAIAQIQEAEANLKLAQANYHQQQQIAAAELDQAQTRLSFAQEKYDRDQALAQAGALPRRQALEAKTELSEAQAHVTRTSSRLEFLEANTQLQRAIANQQRAKSQIKLSDGNYQARLQQLNAAPNPDGTLTIKAPIGGRVERLESSLGESGEEAGKPLFKIINAQDVLVSANIFEKDIAAIQMGQTVRVSIASMPERLFQGQISFIGTGVEGDNRTIPVKVKLNNSTGIFKPGMFANLEILTGQTSETALVIPQSAIVETPEQKTLVFIQNGDAFQPVEVTLGKQSAGLQEVSRGLFAGDRVVTQRAPQLYAESLKNKGVSADHGHASADASSPQLSTNLLQRYWMYPAAGFLGMGLFWAGVTWGRRRDRLTSESLGLSASNLDLPDIKVHPFQERQLPAQIKQEP